VRERALTVGGMATAAVQMRRGAAVARSLAWMRGERGNKGGGRVGSNRGEKMRRKT
jgi:hypothetical protein